MGLYPGGDPQGPSYPGHSYRSLLGRLSMCRGSGNLLIDHRKGREYMGHLVTVACESLAISSKFGDGFGLGVLFTWASSNKLLRCSNTI